MTARTTLIRATPPKSNRTTRTREDTRIGRSFAEREIMRRTGQQPHSEFDDIADGIGAEPTLAARRQTE